MGVVRLAGRLVERYSHHWGIPAILAAWAAWWLNDAKDGEPFRDIAFEFAATAERAAEVVGPFDIDMVRSTLVRDYVFLTFVFIAFAMSVAWVRKQYRPGFWNEAGGVLMWASLGGGLLDVVENTALLGFLGDWFGWLDYWPAVAAAAAGIKWAIVVFAVIYVFVGIALALFRLAGAIPRIHPIELRDDWPGGDGWQDPTHLLHKWREARAEHIDEDFLFEDVAELPDDEREKRDDAAARMRDILQVDIAKGAWDDYRMLDQAAMDWGPLDLDTDLDEEPKPEPVEDKPESAPAKIAICCSGGGVRSATYSFGALQELAAAGKYDDARYLIAVSGGSYIASAYALLDADRTQQNTRHVPPFAPGSPEAHHNRNNSNYLAPTTPAKFIAVGRALIGLLMTVAFVASLLVLIGRPWGSLVVTEGLYPEIALGAESLAAAADDIANSAADISALITVDIDEESESDEADVVGQVPVGLERLAREVDDAAIDLEGRLDATFEVTSAALPAEFIAGTDRLLESAWHLVDETAEVAEACAESGRCDSSLRRGPDLDGLHELAMAVEAEAAAYAEEGRRIATPRIPFSGGWWPILIALLGAVVCGVIAIAVRQIADTANRQRNWARGSGFFLAAFAFLLLTFVVFPFMFTRGPAWLVDQGKTVFAFVQTAGSGAILAAAMAVLVAKRSSLPASLVGGLVAPLLALIAIINIAGGGARAGSLDQWGLVDLLIVVGALAVYLVVAARADLITWSLHPFYRRRLSVAYALKEETADQVVSISPGTERLTFLKGHRPELVICAAANIGDVGVAPAGREANSFTFSPESIHIPNLGLVSTELLESLGAAWEDEVSIQGAVAISGAAASPAMGKQTLPAVRALLALANVRLGVWLPNPLFVQELRKHEFERRGLDNPTAEQRAEVNKDMERFFRKIPASYLLKEIFGLHKARDRFLYVTDGGHWENLGLVEALRRGCTEIYVFDASGDKPDMFTTLGEAIAIARMERDVEVDIDLDPRPIRGDIDPFERRKRKERRPIISADDHVIHSFSYRNADGSSTPGRIIYCKAAVTAGAPPDVIAYQETHPGFPADPTLADQFFDHEQYEAYRALGAYTARRALDSLRRYGAP